MKKTLLTVLIILFIYAPYVVSPVHALTSTPRESVSSSGISKVSVKLKKGPDGKTVEQRNVSRRLEEDNVPGSIKHFYIISPYSGQTIIYSTVRSKVTSSGKRLTPYEVVTATDSTGFMCRGFDIYIGGSGYKTNEVLQDDGTFGHSVPYIFWWDSKDIYHQHFFTGGQIIHLSDQPLPVKNIIINIENMVNPVPEPVTLEK